MKNKIKRKYPDYRFYLCGGVYTVIEVYYDKKGRIKSYSGILTATAASPSSLRLRLITMSKASFKEALTDEDLKNAIHK